MQMGIILWIWVAEDRMEVYCSGTHRVSSCACSCPVRVESRILNVNIAEHTAQLLSLTYTSEKQPSCYQILALVQLVLANWKETKEWEI